MNRECDIMPAPPMATGSGRSGTVRVLYIIDSLWNVGGAEACLLRMTKHLPGEFSSAAC